MARKEAAILVSRERLHELDWLRVLAFFLLIVIHSAMPFLDFQFPVKNGETDSLLTGIFLHFTYIWRLPLIFLVAGMGVWLASRKRNTVALFLERTRRLFLPLLFSTFLVSPLQGYFRAVQNGDFQGMYHEYFLANLMDFPPETFHLWFLVNLFAYCLVLIPLLAFFKSSRGQEMFSLLGKALVSKWGFFAAVVLYVVAGKVASYLPGRFLASWEENAVYSLTMLVGLVLISRREHLEQLQENRWFYVILAAVAFPTYFYVSLTPSLQRIFLLELVLESIARLSIIFALLVIARKFLRKGNRFLEYNNRAVYPYYLIHQTITVTIAFFIVQLDLPIYAKLLMITLGTGLFTWAGYHFLIRPFKLMRPLFGMKSR